MRNIAETQRQGEAKRRRTSMPADSPPTTTRMPHPHFRWDDLPADVLLSVAYAASYPSASRYAILGHVCRGWRAAIASLRPPGAFPCRLPVLALPPIPPTSELHNITSFPDDWGDVPYGIPTVTQTGIAGAVGSSHGWLVVLDPDAAHLSIRNPATGQGIRLPSLLPLLTGTAGSSQSQIDVHRVIISHDPALHTDYVLLLFLAGVSTCCFTFLAGAGAWVAHAHREFHVEDVVFFSGRFVAVDKSNTLALLDWAEDNGGERRLAMTTRRLETRMHDPLVKPLCSLWSVFLVDLKGSLLVATHRTQPQAPGVRMFPGRGNKQILEVDFSQDSGDGSVLTANQRLHLSGHAVFLGHGNSVAVASEWFPALGANVVFCPIITNSVYNSKKRNNGAICIGPYNLLERVDSGTSIPVEFCEGTAKRTKPPAGVWPGPARPLWVVPNLLAIEN